MRSIMRSAFFCCFGLVTMLGFMAGLWMPAHAGPYLVFDYKSGRVIEQNRAFDRWYPASLTKLMTAYVVLHEIRAKRIGTRSPVKISVAARAKPPSKMGFAEGTLLTVDAALKIILVKSANDVSTALAESVGGSEAAFVAKMNAHARRLGLADTHFVNPHGLHDARQYSSARDLAVLARQIYVEFPRWANYFAIPAIKVGKHYYRNHNPFLERFDGAFGMKTGFVCASGLNIVAGAKRRGKFLIAVVLGGRTGQARNVEAAQLLTKAATKPASFGQRKLHQLKPKGIKRGPVNMRAAVCGKKRNLALGDDDEGFALSEASLDQLESQYFKPRSKAIGRYVNVALGGVRGPDPFGLLRQKNKESMIAIAPDEHKKPNFANAFSAGNANQPARNLFNLFKRKPKNIPIPQAPPQR